MTELCGYYVESKNREKRNEERKRGNSCWVVVVHRIVEVLYPLVREPDSVLEASSIEICERHWNLGVASVVRRIGESRILLYLHQASLSVHYIASRSCACYLSCFRT